MLGLVQIADNMFAQLHFLTNVNEFYLSVS
jgi:hypothetical protein